MGSCPPSYARKQCVLLDSCVFDVFGFGSHGLSCQEGCCEGVSESAAKVCLSRVMDVSSFSWGCKIPSYAGKRDAAGVESCDVQLLRRCLSVVSGVASCVVSFLGERERERTSEEEMRGRREEREREREQQKREREGD